jgi:metal-responsive CopG/Arc/MetJ family transcriptional regulator
VPARGWTTITLKDDLVALIDGFLSDNKLGYSNRAEVAAAAVRAFLAHHVSAPPLTDEQLAVAVARYMKRREAEDGKARRPRKAE